VCQGLAALVNGKSTRQVAKQVNKASRNGPSTASAFASLPNRSPQARAPQHFQRETIVPMRIEYHRTMLADRVRNQAFFEALKRVIVPGKTRVADIGCGTGILGFMAARLGAKQVFLLEKSEIVDIAKKLAKHNKIRNIEIVPAHSRDVEPPDRVDVVVSETLGNYAFEENIVETLSDARDRYLEPDGILIPGKVQQFVTPVTAEKYFADLTIWDAVGFGLDFTPAKVMGFNNLYVRTFAPGDLLEAGQRPVAWDAATFMKAATRTTRSGEAAFLMKKSTPVFGLALWWTADLVDGISIATGPSDPKTHWEQLYLPVLEPLVVKAGETLRVRLRSTTSYADGTNVTWTLTVLDAKGKETAKQALDLNKGFLP
jgi:2-polyprenyl-3-methyl-5-hydroxy-6-metoxy-1,4-benzoquinol methylase